GISRSLLVQRLRHLERCGVVELWPSQSGRGNEYHLTAAGRDLEGVLMALGRWAIEWLYEDLRSDDVDALTLTWWMHRRAAAERLNDRRGVVEFHYPSPKRVVVWMILDNGDASVCLHHPGFEPDLVVTTTTTALADVFCGAGSWANAVASGDISVDGIPRL